MGNDPSDKPMLNTLRGQGTVQRPIWLMRQAGRYLPEYREIRTKASNFLDLCFTPTLAAEVTLQPIRRFGFDAAILFSDILVVPHALGQRVWFAEGEGPRLEPVDPSSIAKLDPAQVLTRLAPVFETVSRVRSNLPRSTTLIGFAGAPWTVATYMIAGRGGDDSDAARLFAYRHPEAFKALLNLLVHATTEYLIAQLKAGAEVLQLFESWAGTVSAPNIDAHSIDPIAKIIQGVRKHAPDVPIIVFPRLAGANYQRFAERTGATAISIDTHTSLKWAGESLGKTVLQGNLDPLALIAGGRTLADAVAQIVRDTEGKPHIFNLGHGIRPETPIAHVEELIRLVRSAGA